MLAVHERPFTCQTTLELVITTRSWVSRLFLFSKQCRFIAWSSLPFIAETTALLVSVVPVRMTYFRRSINNACMVDFPSRDGSLATEHKPSNARHSIPRNPAECLQRFWRKSRPVKACRDVQCLNEGFQYDLIWVVRPHVRNRLHVFTVLTNHVFLSNRVRPGGTTRIRLQIIFYLCEFDLSRRSREWPRRCGR